jgi:UPF0042 nucleotide-binding protein
MRLILISGMSGSGKSVAIRLLEDLGYYCVDNLPAPLLPQACGFLAQEGQAELAVSIDSRSAHSLAEVPAVLEKLRAGGADVRLLFLTASDDALVQRFSETRRRHPLSPRHSGVPARVADPTLEESIARERELVRHLAGLGQVIDTSTLPASTLRQWVTAFAGSSSQRLTLAFESFAYKSGVPLAADLVFDVRNLPNPHYERELRPLTGLDAPVAAFLQASPEVAAMIADLQAWLQKWLPSYLRDGRQYLTVAVGCTGGQHRSPYVVETLARHFGGPGQVLVRHRALQR